ncbi:hypothetical protein [Psychrobacter sp. JCM 18901]|uniref:hypothetical protein n=1 Tax=Psychrobacter sp. JCM 18901 TaxID=1298609 RepID=UPI00351C8710
MQNDTQPLNDTLVSKSLSAADYVPTLDAMLARTLERIDLKKQQGYVRLMNCGLSIITMSTRLDRQVKKSIYYSVLTRLSSRPIAVVR